MQVATTISDDNGMIVKRLSVPIGLEELMESLTKQVLLKKPRDLFAFASEHFAHLLTLRDKTMKDGGIPQSPSNSDKEASKALKSIKVKSHTVATKYNKLPTPIIFTNSNTKRQTTPIANTKRNTKKNSEISPRLVDRSLTSSTSSHKSNKTEPANQGRVGGRARWKKRDSSVKDQKLPISLPPKKPTAPAKIAVPVSRPKKNEDKSKTRPISNRSTDDKSDSKKEAMKRRSNSVEAKKKKPTLSQSSSVDESISVKGASISLNNKNRSRKSKSPTKPLVAPVVAVAGVAAAAFNNKKRGDVAINNEINLEKSDKQDLMESIKSDVDSSLAEISDSILIKDELKVEIKDDAGDSDFVDEDDKESFVIEEGGNDNEDGRERLETIAERAMSKQDVANMADVIEEKTDLKEVEEVSNALAQEELDMTETNLESALIEKEVAEITAAVENIENVESNLLTQEGIDVTETKLEDTLIEEEVAKITEAVENIGNAESNVLTQEDLDVMETKLEDSLIEKEVVGITEAVENIENADLEAKIKDSLVVDTVSGVSEISEAVENMEQAELEKLEDALIENKTAEVIGITEAIENTEQNELEEKLEEVAEDMPILENIDQAELENKVDGITEAMNSIEDSVKEEADADTVEIVELAENETVENVASEENKEVIGIVETEDDIITQSDDAKNGVEIIELETDNNNDISAETNNTSDEAAVIEDKVILEVTNKEDSVNVISPDKNEVEDIIVVEEKQEPDQIGLSNSEETEIKEGTQVEVVNELQQQIDKEVANLEEGTEDTADSIEESASAAEEAMDILKLKESIDATGDEFQKHEEELVETIEAQEDVIKNKIEDQSIDVAALKNVSDETIKDILLSDAKANEIIEQDEKIKDVLLDSMENTEFGAPSDMHNLTSRFLSLEKENYDTNKTSTEGQTAFEERELVEKIIAPQSDNLLAAEVVEQVNEADNSEAPSILETISRKLSDVKAFFTPGSREKESDDAPGDIDKNAEENLEALNKEKTEIIMDEDMKIATADVVDSTENNKAESILKIEEASPFEAKIETTPETEDIILETTDGVKLVEENIESAEHNELDSIITVEENAIVNKKDEEDGLLVELPYKLDDSNNGENIIVEDALSSNNTQKSEAENIVNPEEKTSQETFAKEEVNNTEDHAANKIEEIEIQGNNEENKPISDSNNVSSVEQEEKLAETAPITEIEVPKSSIKVYDDLIIETTSDGAEILNLEQQVLNDNKGEEKTFTVEDINAAAEIAEETTKVKQAEVVEETPKENAGDHIEGDAQKSHIKDEQLNPEESESRTLEDLKNKLEEDTSKTSTVIEEEITTEDGSSKLEEIVEANVDLNSDKSINLSEIHEDISQRLEDQDKINTLTNDSEVENKSMNALENDMMMIEKNDENANAAAEESDYVIDEKHDLVVEDEGHEIKAEMDIIHNNDSKKDIIKLQDKIVATNIEADRPISPKFSNESILNLGELQIEDEENILRENLPSHIEDEGPLQLEALTQYLMSQNNSSNSENETSDNNKEKEPLLNDDKELEALSQYLMNKPDIGKIIDDKDKTDTHDKGSLEPDDDTDNQVDSLTNSTSSTNNNNNNNEWESKEIFGQTVKPNEPLVEALKIFPEHQAATKIQSVWRGHNTRKMAVPQQLSGDLSSISDDAVTAATVIQAFVRGHLVRKELSKDNLIGNKIRKLEPFIEESGEIEDALVKLEEIKVPDDEPEISINSDKKEINDKTNESNAEMSEKSEENNTYTVAADGKDISVEDNTYIVKQDDPKQNEKNITEQTNPDDVIVGHLNYIMQGDSQENADIPSTKETELETTKVTTSSSSPATEEVVLSDKIIKDTSPLENQLDVKNAKIDAMGKSSTNEVDNLLEKDKTTDEAHRDKLNISNVDEKLTNNNDDIIDSIVSDNILENKDSNIKIDLIKNNEGKAEDGNDLNKNELVSNSNVSKNVSTEKSEEEKSKIDTHGENNVNNNEEINKDSTDTNIAEISLKEKDVEDQNAKIHINDKMNKEINQNSKLNEINIKNDDVPNLASDSNVSDVQNNVIDTNMRPEESKEQKQNLDSVVLTSYEAKEGSSECPEEAKINLKNENQHEENDKIENDINTDKPLKSDDVDKDNKENAVNLNLETTPIQMTEKQEIINDEENNDAKNLMKEANIVEENDSEKSKDDNKELASENDNSQSKDNTDTTDGNNLLQKNEDLQTDAKVDNLNEQPVAEKELHKPEEENKELASENDNLKSKDNTETIDGNNPLQKYEDLHTNAKIDNLNEQPVEETKLGKPKEENEGLASESNNFQSKDNTEQQKNNEPTIKEKDNKKEVEGFNKDKIGDVQTETKDDEEDKSSLQKNEDCQTDTKLEEMTKELVPEESEPEKPKEEHEESASKSDNKCKDSTENTQMKSNGSNIKEEEQNEDLDKEEGEGFNKDAMGEVQTETKEAHENNNPSQKNEDLQTDAKLEEMNKQPIAEYNILKENEPEKPNEENDETASKNDKLISKANIEPTQNKINETAIKEEEKNKEELGEFNNDEIRDVQSETKDNNTLQTNEDLQTDAKVDEIIKHPVAGYNTLKENEPEKLKEENKESTNESDKSNSKYNTEKPESTTNEEQKNKDASKEEEVEWDGIADVQTETKDDQEDINLLQKNEDLQANSKLEEMNNQIVAGFNIREENEPEHPKEGSKESTSESAKSKDNAEHTQNKINEPSTKEKGKNNDTSEEEKVEGFNEDEIKTKEDHEDNNLLQNNEDLQTDAKVEEINKYSVAGKEINADEVENSDLSKNESTQALNESETSLQAKVAEERKPEENQMTEELDCEKTQSKEQQNDNQSVANDENQPIEIPKNRRKRDLSDIVNEDAQKQENIEELENKTTNENLLDTNDVQKEEGLDKDVQSPSEDKLIDEDNNQITSKDKKLQNTDKQEKEDNSKILNKENNETPKEEEEISKDDETQKDEIHVDSLKPSDQNSNPIKDSPEEENVKTSENIKENTLDIADSINEEEDKNSKIDNNLTTASIEDSKNTVDNNANATAKEDIDNEETNGGPIQIDSRGNFEDDAEVGGQSKDTTIDQDLNDRKDVKDVGSNFANIEREDSTSSKQEIPSDEQAEDDLKIGEQHKKNESHDVVIEETPNNMSPKEEIDNDNNLQDEAKSHVDTASSNLGKDTNNANDILAAVDNSDILGNKDVETGDKNFDENHQKSLKSSLENTTNNAVENNEVQSEETVGAQIVNNPSLESNAQVDDSNMVANNKDLAVDSKDETNNGNAQDAHDDKAQNTQTNIEDINKIEQTKKETIQPQENAGKNIKEFQLGARKENVTSNADMYKEDSIQDNEKSHNDDSDMSNDFNSIETNDDDHETKDILAQIRSDLNHMRNLITNKDGDELATDNSQENDNKAEHLNNADKNDPEEIHSPLGRLSTTSLDTTDRDNHFDRLVSTGSTTSLDSAATVLLTEDLNKWRAKNDLNEGIKPAVEDHKEEDKDKLISIDSENSDDLKKFNKTKAPKIGSDLTKAVSIEEAAMRIQNFFKCYMANKHDDQIEENDANNKVIQNKESNTTNKSIEDINHKNVKQRPTLGQCIRSLADSTSPPPDLSLDLQRLKTPSPNNLNTVDKTKNIRRINSPSLNDSDKSNDAIDTKKVEPIKNVDVEKPEPFYLHEPDKIIENPISAAIRASSQMTNQEPSIGLLHSSEFHDTIPLNFTPTNQQVIVQNHPVPSRTATPSPPGLLHSSEMHDALIPRFRDAAAGAAPVTVAQASDKDGQARSETETDKEDVSRESVSELELSDMDGKRNNAAIAEKNTESEAATKIQASFRGYQVRKQLKTTGGGDITSPRRSGRRKSSGRVIDSNKNPPKKDKGELEERSATKIQAGIRGFLVRRRQKNKNESP